MHAPKWKKSLPWQGRKSGSAGAAGKPEASQPSNNACASPHTVRLLAECPKPASFADNSTSVTSSPIPQGALGRSPLPSTTSANDDARRWRDGSLPGAGDTKKDYWQLAVDKLQEEDSSLADQIMGMQQAAAAGGNRHFATQLLHAVQQGRKAIEDKRWKITTSSREVVLRDQFDRLVKVVTSIKDVASAAASLDPLHVGLPLAGFCVLMQVWLAAHGAHNGDTDSITDSDQRLGPIRSHGHRRGRDCHYCGTISTDRSPISIAT
jgi:hypothetical protein